MLKKGAMPDSLAAPASLAAGCEAGVLAVLLIPPAAASLTLAAVGARAAAAASGARTAPRAL